MNSQSVLLDSQNHRMDNMDMHPPQCNFPGEIFHMSDFPVPSPGFRKGPYIFEKVENCFD